MWHINAISFVMWHCTTSAFKKDVWRTFSFISLDTFIGILSILNIPCLWLLDSFITSIVVIHHSVMHTQSATPFVSITVLWFNEQVISSSWWRVWLYCIWLTWNVTYVTVTSHFVDLTVTLAIHLTFDYNECHVIKFRPISEAACSWSYGNYRLAPKKLYIFQHTISLEPSR